MLNEAILVGVFLLILFSAGFIYLFYRLEYVEKKAGMMENVLVDIRMTLESLMAEDRSAGVEPMPVASALPMGGMQPAGAPVMFTPPTPLEASEAEKLPEESYYASVLSEAHEGVGESGPVETEIGTTLEAALEGMQAEGASGPGLVTTGGMELPSAAPAAGPNYDVMTRQELLALAEKRGVRIRKSANRTEIINTLRRTAEVEHRDSEGRGENVSGMVGGSLAEVGSSLDGESGLELGDASVPSTDEVPAV